MRRPSRETKNVRVWKWKRKNTTYLIVAKSEKQAKNWALKAAKAFAKQRKGLAKHALGVLMAKSGSRTSEQAPNSEVKALASRLGEVEKISAGERFSLTAKDMLDYAKLALNGGEAAISQALMKAANKATSVINQKCKKLLLFEKLETPFPEVRSRK